jgi:hypothetical protein
MDHECSQKETVERNRRAIEGKDGLISDMAVVKFKTNIIITLNTVILGAMVKILFFGA